MTFQDDISNKRTDGLTDGRTQRSKPICSPTFSKFGASLQHFQSWELKENIWLTEQGGLSQKVTTQQPKLNQNNKNDIK